MVYVLEYTREAQASDSFDRWQWVSVFDSLAKAKAEVEEIQQIASALFITTSTQNVPLTPTYVSEALLMAISNNAGSAPALP